MEKLRKNNGKISGHKKRASQDSDFIRNMVVASEFESPTPTMSRWH